MSRPSGRGIALVLVSGILTVMALLSVVFSQLARLGSAGAAPALAACRAGLAASSGLAYGGARLWQVPVPTAQSSWSPANACDDWTVRGKEPAGTPPGALLNPSYSRGERWTDQAVPGAVAGAYDPGIDSILGPAWSDKDGDGKFSAWTGRLRAEGGRFGLRIASVYSRICVNSGEIDDSLGDHDMDGTLNRDDPEYPMLAAGRWNDPDHPGNTHLVNLLNNLGAVVGTSDAVTAPYAPPPATHSSADPAVAMGTVETSTLGRRIVLGRPREGYASLDALRSVLGPADYAKAAPFLSSTGRIIPVAFPLDPVDKTNLPYKLFLDPEERYEFHATVDFNTAPVEVLQSVLRYISASGPPGMGQVGTRFTRLLKDEADALARALADARPIHTWSGFLAAVHQNAALFQPDPLGSGSALVLDKENLVLAQVRPDWIAPDPFCRSASTLGVPRDEDPSEPARATAIPKAALAGFLCSFPVTVAGGEGGGGQGQAQAPFTSIPSRITTELSLTPDYGSFLLSSEGEAPAPSGRARRGAAGEFSVFSRSLSVTGQQQFEPLFTAFPNPPTWRFPGGDASMAPGAGNAGARSGIQSYPRFPFRRGTTSNFTVASSAWFQFGLPHYRYPKTWGWLQLAARPRPVADAAVSGPGVTEALSFNEDLGPPYAGSSWLDNLRDPVSHGLAHTVSATDNGFAVGTCLSPAGPRRPGDTGSFEIKWTVQPPFACSDYASHVPQLKWVEAGTIAFWVPAPSQDGAIGDYLGQGTEVDLQYCSALPVPPDPAQWKTFLAIGREPDRDTLSFKVATGQFANLISLPPPATAPATKLAETGWRFVAVTLRRQAGTDVVAADFYLDGTLLNSSPIPCSFDKNDLSHDPVNSQMRLLLSGPIDDLTFYDSALPYAEIIDRMVKPKYEAGGTYRSWRIAFDAERFPDGASLAGMAWDGMVPPGIGGRMTLRVKAYGDPAAPPIAVREVLDWNATTPPVLDFAPVTGVRSFTLEAEMAANPPPVDIQDESGAVLSPGVQILRDSPVLEGITLRYGDARPRWSGVSFE